MKQRLLLALLVLFAAAGMVKAQTSFTRVTSGTPVTITVSGISGGNVSCDAAQEDVKNSNGKSSWTFNVKSSETDISLQVEAGAKYTGLVVNGNITTAIIDHANLTSLEFTNNGRKLSSLTLTKAALTSLKCNDCFLSAIPSTNTAFGNTATISLENNNITTISTYPDFGKYDATHNRTVTINLNNNKIVGAIPSKTSGSGVTVNYGTQNLSYTASKIKSNEWFATIEKLVKGTDKLFTSAGADYKDLTISWKLQNGSSSITTTNSVGDVMFYNGGKYYDGVVECTIKKKDNTSAYPTYVYSLTVDPAEFTLTKEVSVGGNLGVYNGSTEVTTQKVKVGDILTLVPKANDGFTFEKYENVRGLTPTTDDANKYQVTGDGEKPDVAITATFKALAYTVKHSGSANGTYKVICDGEEVTSGSTVGYGKKLTIEAIPAASNYKTRVIVNGAEQSVTTGDPVEIPVSFFVSATSASTVNIEVIFEAEKEYSIGVTVPAGITVKINGQPKTNTATVDIKPGSTVVVEVEETDGYKLNQILLNAKAISTSTKTTFTMPDQDVSLNFVVVQLTEIKINAKNDVTTYPYTGNEQEFLYTTEPAGISDIKIQYSKDNGVTYTDKKPVDAGTYKIKAIRSAKDGYKYLETTKNASNADLTMTISNADPQITLPTVSVDNSNKYVITGGSAKLGSKSLTGTFEVTSDGTNSITNNVCVKAESHIATVKYTVTGADKGNFNTVTVNVPVKYKNTDALSTFKLQWGTIPTDMTLKVMNGAAEVANNTNVAIGTTLTFILTYARGYAAYIIENKSRADKDWGLTASDANLEIDNNNPSYIIKKITKTINDPLEKLSITYTGVPTAKTLDVSITTPVAAKEYNPAGQDLTTLYTTSSFTIKLGNTVLSSLTTPALTDVAITYKDASGKIVPKPTAVGKYTVCVYIPALKEDDNTTIKETNVEFKDKLEITKAKITSSEVTWPTTAILGVGQTLANASFEGGNAPVAGKFTFVDESKKAVDGESYAIKFVPDDKNYEELVTDKTATVVFSNKRILLIDNIQNGSVTVKDNSGRVYNSKDELPAAITELIITATPAANYKLDKLTVNNATITNGSTYKLTESSITVSATFYASYKVTVTKPSKGTVVTLPSSSEVKKGESYSFTVACLTADKSKIVVKDGSTVITGTDGKYTISNITADKAISITLDNPTAITVAADTTLSPHKKPMGTVKITGTTDGKCYYGETVTVKATPVSGVQFAGWVGRSETTASLSIKATEPSYKFKAKYTGSPTGIETIEGIRIYGSEGSIFIGCDGDARVTIISMEGRVKKAEISGDTRIEMAAGIYGVILEKGSEVMKTKVIVR